MLQINQEKKEKILKLEKAHKDEIGKVVAQADA